MACCAAAAFFISQIVLAFESVRRRLFGASMAKPQCNEAVMWTPGSPAAANRSPPRRARRLIVAVLMAEAVLVAGTVAPVVGLSDVHAVVEFAAAIERGLERTGGLNVSAEGRRYTNGSNLANAIALQGTYPDKSDGPQLLKTERLQPNRRYAVSGATSDTLVADSNGSASLTVQLSGRSSVRITAAV